MCGRYSLSQKLPKIEARFGAQASFEQLPRRYNIAPTHNAPVVLNRVPEVLQLLKWGFPMPRNDSKVVFNARSETVTEKRMFKAAFVEARCLVPFDGYYEWKFQGRGGKQPYRITLPQQELAAFAGVWKTHPESEEKYFSILTKAAPKALQNIHSRVPVIVPQVLEKHWLQLDTNAENILNEILRYQPEDFVFYPVSKQVNNVRNEAPELTEPHGGVQTDLFGS